jgi:hypothetical protein
MAVQVLHCLSVIYFLTGGGGVAGPEGVVLKGIFGVVKMMVVFVAAGVVVLIGGLLVVLVVVVVLIGGLFVIVVVVEEDVVVVVVVGLAEWPKRMEIFEKIKL